MALDRQTQHAYRGKVIKQSIERNRLSSVKRKYFKELEREARDATQAPAERPQQPTHGDSSSAPPRADSHKHTQRTNPYQKILREREEVAKKREEEKQQREAEIRQAKARRLNSARQRKYQQKKHNARTPRGQPLLSNQIAGLLKKIQKTS